MPTLQEFVLETLTCEHIDQLNFRFGHLLVYPSGYRDDIAGAIRNGRIRLTSDPAEITSNPHGTSASGSFVADTPRGEVHPFFINPEFTVSTGGVLHVRDGLSRSESASLRGTIVHESTHALQDYQRLGTPDPRAAEGAAYLAGAITAHLWGYRTVGAIVNPRVSGRSYAIVLAERFLRELPSNRYVISREDVSILQSLVTTGGAHRYVFDGI
ncbi:MAG: hypothetical protein HC882_04855 [Acidobacteria bacterium]|nr:hypothetical protein [Acidobacteriota bacterium]